VEGVCGTRADFSDANLSSAAMRNMDLRGADFSRADLEGADLTGSLLTGADFTTALHLKGADLDGVCYESGMADMWPDALGMEASMEGDPTSPLCNPGL
jgi:uncharacterized protein YjbI with pentapeptide repeats